MMVGNEEFVPENLIHNLFFLRAEKTRQHSFKREKNVRSASILSSPKSFSSRSPLPTTATKQVLQTHFKSEQKEAKRDLTYSVENQTTRREVQKGQFLQTLNSSKVKKGKEKKNKTLQNTLRESFFLAEEERHAHLKHTLKTRYCERGDDDDEGRV